MKDAYKNLPEELMNNSSLADEIKFQQEKQEEIKKRRHKRKYFILGFTVILFSIIGFVSVIWAGVTAISDTVKKNSQEDYNSYSSFLLSVCAVDPQPFDDVTAAPMKELVEIAVWSIIGSDLDPAKYDYSSGELAIPASEVEAAFTSYFSSQVKIEHCSVTGYGYEFKYNAEKNSYYIPLTTIDPLYTPDITSVETKGGATVITLGLINANAWMQDSVTGNISAPEPDKYLKVTLREFGGASYISSIQSTGLPETAIVDVFTTKPPEPQTDEEETEAEESSTEE